VAAAAALIGEPARAAVLSALTEEAALPASELAARARVAPSTTSGHLAKLAAGGLIVGERRGRHRYFRLADPAVAAAIEALSAIAPEKPVRSLRDATVGEAVRYARTCYDHLAGRLAVELTAALEREHVLVHDGDGYRLGSSGRPALRSSESTFMSSRSSAVRSSGPVSTGVSRNGMSPALSGRRWQDVYSS